MATIVYRYGVRDHAAAHMPAEIAEQIRLAHRMRNDLVELERAHDEEMRLLWSSHPQVATVEAQLTTAEDQVTELTLKAKQEHSIDRTVATRTATATALKAAKLAVKTLRQSRREAIDDARAIMKPGIEAEKLRHKQVVKELRQQYAANGLYWGTYNMVLADHRVRVQLVGQRRKTGRAADYHFHRFDGSGTIAVQLQREAADGDRARSPVLLAGDERHKWRNVLQLGPWLPPDEFDALPRSARRVYARTGLATIAVGGGSTVALPIAVHRMIPADGDVCEASLTYTRIAGNWTAALSVTVKLPDPSPVQGRAPVAIHAGWRLRPDSSVRVGTWASATSLTVLEHLVDWVSSYDDGTWGEIIIPAGVLDAAGRPPSLRSRRDLNLEPVQRKLADWLDVHPQPGVGDRPDLTGAAVRQWRSPNRFVALALRWRDAPPQGQNLGEIVDMLEAWRVQDRHLWEWECHLRHALTGRRDDTWRKVGAWLADVAGVLVADDADLAELRRRGDVEDDDPMLPGVVAQKARARAALSAPGRLRQLVTAACVRRGVSVRVVASAGLTRTHRVCGQVGAPDPRYAASAVVICPHCGLSYDQDYNAAMLMLDRERLGGDRAER